MPLPSLPPSLPRHYGFQLYESDPAGTFGGWTATAIGANYQVSPPPLPSLFAHSITLILVVFDSFL